LTDLLADLGDLVQKEIQLAKAEVTEKITSRLRASVWMMAAAVLGLIAGLLVLEAAVFAIASFGLALHWACLLVGAILAAAGAAAFYHGRSVAEAELLPTRTVRQVSQDIKTAKEQLT
jgi:putative superfamily III holin-X